MSRLKLPHIFAYNKPSYFVKHISLAIGVRLLKVKHLGTVARIAQVITTLYIALLHFTQFWAD